MSYIFLFTLVTSRKGLNGSQFAVHFVSYDNFENFHTVGRWTRTFGFVNLFQRLRIFHKSFR